VFIKYEAEVSSRVGGGEIDAWFLLKSNRKPYALYRMVALLADFVWSGLVRSGRARVVEFSYKGTLSFAITMFGPRSARRAETPTPRNSMRARSSGRRPY